MRTEKEVSEMVARLEKFNEAAEKQIANGEDVDEHAHIFNMNSEMLTALKWTLGAETITVKRSG